MQMTPYLSFDGQCEAAFRRKTRCIAMIVGCGLAVGSCTSTEPIRDLGPVPDGPFNTDASGYVAQRVPGSDFQFHFKLIARFQNRGLVPLYLGRCLPNSPGPIFGVVASHPSTDDSGYDQFWGCVGHDQQFEVLPGASRIDTLDVRGPNSVNGLTHVPIGRTEGEFRLYFEVNLTRGDGGTPASESLRLSNAFVVRTAP